MQRCIALAKLGAGHVAPNPMVGAVLVHNETIIGEGYHQQYGQAHAEVNCIKSVDPKNQSLIPNSTLYVSLEPCAHFGKTPPCSLLILEKKIKKVVVGCSDPFKQVNGKGIEQLKAAGVEVIVDVLKDKCLKLNKRFFTFHAKQRPYIILKWAQTSNHKIAACPSFSNAGEQKRLFISNEIINRLVHKWRSEAAAILVGTNTALLDNPSLTNRLWHGNHPIRLVIDKHLKLPPSLHLLNGEVKTVVFNYHKQEAYNNLIYHQLNKEEHVLEAIMQACYQLNIQSILVEGGSHTLQSFIDTNLWDEASIITNTTLTAPDGLNAPTLQGQLIQEEKIMTDTIQYFNNIHA
jgi:diaminohydroxyphosphoribosylaminopyrimidine deaminase/5-amino-6-(5-phosphoribosylamino)uracil reductase